MRPEREALIEAMAKAIAPPMKAGRWNRIEDRQKLWYREKARIALAAIEAHNGGCRVVPAEPTPEMREAAASVEHDDHTVSEIVLNEFKASCAASPYAPSSNDAQQVKESRHVET